jgi:hypothetical protein
MLTEEALDAAGRVRRGNLNETEVAEALSFELFDDDLLTQALLMSTVYTAIAAFEMSVRRFVKKVLMDTHGEDWWDKGVSEKIRKFVETRRSEEEKVKWHGVRGDDRGCQVVCVSGGLKWSGQGAQRGLEVGVDAVGVDEGEFAEGGFPALDDGAFDEFAGGLAGVALGSGRLPWRVRGLSCPRCCGWPARAA